MSTTSTERVAEHVRIEMARRRLTQTALAAAADIDQATLSRRLRAEYPFTVPELERVAAAMNVPISVLLGEDDPTPAGSRRAAS